MKVIFPPSKTRSNVLSLPLQSVFLGSRQRRTVKSNMAKLRTHTIKLFTAVPLEQRSLKIVNNCFNTNIYSYLETSGGQSSNLYLNVVDFFNTSLN
jgi:hypothetical protein